MKKVYVVRHADSSWDNQLLDDFDRPLSEKGVRDAKNLADFFVKKKYMCDSIIYSSAARTTQTATYLNQTLSKYHLINLIGEKSLYLSSIDEVIEILNNHLKQNSSIMYVGHNPTITTFINYISNASIDHVPSGAMALINLNQNKLLESSGKLVEFIYPKKLKFL